MEDNLATLYGGVEASPPVYPQSGMQTAIDQKPFEDRAEATPFMDVVSVSIGLNDTGINAVESFRLGSFPEEDGYEPPEDLMDQMEARGIAAHHLDALLDTSSSAEFEARMNLYEQRAIDERWVSSMGGKGTGASVLGAMADLPGLALDGAATAVGGAGLVSRGKRMVAAGAAFGTAGAARGYLGSRVDDDYTPGKAFVDFAANAAFGAAFQGGYDWLHPAERIALQNKMLAKADATNPATIARKAAEAQAAMVPTTRPLTDVDRRVREMSMRSEEAIRGGRNQNLTAPNLLPTEPSAAVPGATPAANARAIAIQQERLMRARMTPEKATETIQAEMGRLRSASETAKTPEEIARLKDEHDNLQWMVKEQARNLETGKGELLDVELNKLVTERNDLLEVMAVRDSADVLSDGVAPLTAKEVAGIETRLAELASLVPARAKAVTDAMVARQGAIVETMRGHTAGQAAGFQYRDFMTRYMLAKRNGTVGELELAESLVPRKPVQSGVDLDALPVAPVADDVAPDAATTAAKQLEDAADADIKAQVNAAEEVAQKEADALEDATLELSLTEKAKPELDAVEKSAAQKVKAAVAEAVAKSRKAVDETVAKAKAALEEATGTKVAAVIEKMSKKMDKAVEELKGAAAVIADPKIRAINLEMEKAVKTAMAGSKEQVKAAYQKAVKDAEDVATAAKAKVSEATKKSVAGGADKDVAKAAKVAAFAKIDAAFDAAKAAAKKSNSVSTEAAAAIAAFKADAEAKIAAVNAAAAKSISAKKSKLRDEINEASSLAIGKVKAAAAESTRKELQKVKAEAKRTANTDLVKAIRTAELSGAEDVAASSRTAAAKIAAAVEEARGVRLTAREKAKASAPVQPVAQPAPTVAQAGTTVPTTGTPVASAVPGDDSAGAMRTPKSAVDQGIDYDQQLTVGGDVLKMLEEEAQVGADMVSKTPTFGGLGYISGILRRIKDPIANAMARKYVRESVMALKDGKQVVNEVAISDLAAVNYNTLWADYRRGTEEQLKGYFTGFKGAAKRWLSAKARQDFQARVTRAKRGHHEDNPFIQRAVAASGKAFDDALALMQKYGVQGAAVLQKAADYVPRMPKRDFIEAMGLKIKSTYQGETGANEIVESLLAKAIDLGFTRAGKAERFREGVTAKVAKAMADRLFYKSKSPNLYEAPKFELDHLDDILRDSGVSLEDRNTIANFFDGKDPVNASNAVASDHMKHRVMMDETASITLDDGSVLTISDLFEDDMETIVNEYLRHASGLAAFAERGIDNPKKAWAIIEDMKSKGTIDDDEFGAFEIAHKSFLGMPLESDPAGRATRALRTLGNLNFTTMLGQVAWPQIIEMGGILAEGGWRAMAQQIPELKSILKQAYDGKLETTMARQMAVLGEPGASGVKNPISMRAQDYDIIGKAGSLEQASRAMARTASYVSGMVPMTDALQIFNSRVFMQSLYNTSKSTDALPEAWLNRLKDYGMDTDDVVALRAHLAANGKERNGTLIDVALDAMDPALQRKLQVMMHRQVRRVVQEQSIEDTMPWAHSAIAKAVLQFRMFSLGALPRKTLHAVYRNDAVAYQSFVYGLGFAGLALAGRTAATHPSDSKHYQDVFSSPGRFMALAWASTGEASVLPMLWDTVAAVSGHDYKFGSASRSSGNASDFITGNPTVAMMNDIGTALKILPKLAVGGTFTQEDYRALAGLSMTRTMHGLAMAHRVFAGKFPSQWEVDSNENR